jgi:hypothetical protein
LEVSRGEDIPCADILVRCGRASPQKKQADGSFPVGQVPHAHEKNWKEDEVGLPKSKKRRWEKLGK